MRKLFRIAFVLKVVGTLFFFAAPAAAIGTSTGTPKVYVYQGGPAAVGSITGSSLTVTGASDLRGGINSTGTVTLTGTMNETGAVTMKTLTVTDSLTCSTCSASVGSAVISTLTVTSSMTAPGQIVASTQTTISVASSTTAGSFVNSQLVLTITPQRAGNLIRISFSSCFTAGTGGSGGVTFTRNGSNIGASGGFFRAIGIAAANPEYPFGIVYTDAPNSTSALTYRVQIKCDGSNSCQLGETNTTTTFLLEEIYTAK